MGAVYVVEQVSTGRRRALKVMREDLALDAKSRERFVQEARVGSRIASAHVVEVLDAGIDETAGAPWLVMELLEGESLHDRVRLRGPVAAPEALAIFGQLGHALEHAHAEGIVHRDLKPENVFLARSRRSDGALTVKVLDFGIAKFVSEASRHATTQAIGTPFWMAPEQSDPSGRLGPWTDVWALGLLAFYALAGKAYWHAANAEHASMQQALRELLLDPIEPATVRAARLGAAPLPPAFDAWFARCVDREPHARIATVPEALAGLRAALAHAPVAHAATEPIVWDTAPRPVAASVEAAPARSTTTGWLVGGALGLLALLSVLGLGVAGAVVLAGGGERDPSSAAAEPSARVVIEPEPAPPAPEPLVVAPPVPVPVLEPAPVVETAGDARRRSWLERPFRCRAISSTRLRTCRFRVLESGAVQFRDALPDVQCDDVRFDAEGNPSALNACRSLTGKRIPRDNPLRETTSTGARTWSGSHSGWYWDDGEPFCCPGIWLVEPRE